MKERIKEIRKARGLNQSEFGAKIGVAQTTIAGYESGARAVSDAAILSICREFGVSEIWLRTGAGDMFEARPREAELAELVKSLFRERPDSFRAAAVAALLRFDPDGPEWAVLERIYKGIADELDKGAPPDPPDE